MRLVLVVVALAFTAACGSPPVEELTTTAAVPVTVEPAKVDAIETTIEVTGTVTPAPGGDWTITAPEAARIVEVPKAEGDAVKTGDLLVRFEIPNLAAELEAKRAAVKQATARLDAAKANVARLAGLVERGVAAQREVEEARRDQSEAEADLAQAQSGVTAATTLAERATVHARFNGVIAKRWHNPGDLVEAAATDPVLRVINPRELQVIAQVPIADLSRAVPGRPARITGPGGGNGEAAHVVNRPGQVEPGGTLAEVRIAFAAPTHLPAGTAVQVSIIADRKAKALIVPAAAIVHDGDETFVMVAGSDNKAHKHVVKLGLTGREAVEITEGVSAGDLVIIRGQDELPDGAAITVSK